MYDFAKRPLWVLSHVLVLLAVVVMVRLGFWQMSRWHEEQRNAERIEEGLAATPQALPGLLEELGSPAATEEVPESAEYKRVTVEGTWNPDEEVLIRNRSLDGAPGGWLVTPLVTEDGSAVAVLRGWVPLEMANSGPPYPGTEAPEGPAEVTGVVQRTQQGGGLGASDPAEGELESLARVDLDRLGEQLQEPLVPLWLVLESSSPSQPDGVLRTVAVETPSPSQNFSYMMQWWFFSLIAVVGYALILRKVAHSNDPEHRRSEVPEEDPPEQVVAR